MVAIINKNILYSEPATSSVAVILATEEVEIRRITVGSQPAPFPIPHSLGKWFIRSYLKKPITKKG
jgi:hypothetical protein